MPLSLEEFKKSKAETESRIAFAVGQAIKTHIEETKIVPYSLDVTLIPIRGGFPQKVVDVHVAVKIHDDL